MAHLRQGLGLRVLKHFGVTLGFVRILVQVSLRGFAEILLPCHSVGRPRPMILASGLAVGGLAPPPPPPPTPLNPTP